MMMKNVLLIEDDTKMAKLLKEYLGGFQFEVTHAITGTDGLKHLATKNFELILLDLMLPDKDGFEVCKEIRTVTNTPIIMLTARGETSDKVVGLELGADDYMAKPFEPRELVARMQAIIRRRTNILAPHGEKIIAENLVVYPSTLVAKLNREEIALTAHELNLLVYLMQQAPQVVSRDQIMDHLSGIDNSAFDRSIDVTVSRIRQKLSDHPKHPQWIKTVWGQGYLFLKKVTYEN